MTDGLSRLLPLLEQNTLLNGLTLDMNGEHVDNVGQSAVRVHVSSLSWGQPISASIPREPDILLAADCAYFEPSFPLLLNTLKLLIGINTILWFCYKKRRKADKVMVRMLKKTFNVREVKGTWEQDGIWLFEVRERDSLPKGGAKQRAI